MALTRPKYSQIYDTDYKQSVRVATTADVGNLLATGNMTDSVDGVDLAFLDRILVKDQIDPKQNGIYRVLTVGTGSNGTWGRALDANANDKVTSGLTTIISEGDVNAYKTFKLATSDPIIVGTTPLTFVNPFDTGSNVVAGANGQIQYNNFGVPGASPGLSFDALANVLTVGGNVSITTPTPGNLKTISAGTTANLPSPGQVGRVYIDTDDDSILYDDGVEWVSIGGAGGFTASTSAPADPDLGELWWDTELDILFQYINDGDSNQWVDTTSATTVYSGGGGTSYTNSDVAAYLPTHTGNVSANYFIGNTVQVAGNLTAENIIGNIITSATAVEGAIFTLDSILNIETGTSNIQIYSSDDITISSAGTANVVVIDNNSLTVTGNVSATFFIGDGSQLTGLPESYSNSNVAAYLPTHTGNIGGNIITANAFVGDGSQLTGLPAGYTDSNVAAYLPTHTGNVSATFFIGDGSQLTGLPESYTNSNVAAYLPTHTGNISGNVITANIFVGDGSQLTGLPESYTNSNVAAYLPTHTGNITAGNIAATTSISVAGSDVIESAYFVSYMMG
jgi:hypothetical protein